jgi:hypothetical protein
VLVGNPSPYKVPRRLGPGPPPTPILTGPGSVSVLDAGTGTVLRAVVVGRAPLANDVGPAPGNGSVSIVAITP